jgi:translation initiation factor eIF-2B subunit gamma
VSSDSVVGYSTSIDKQASIKKSVIGKHCVIGKMVKIIGCVILDHCVIGDGYVSLFLFAINPYINSQLGLS